MKNILTLLFCILTLQTIAQQRRIAYRHDDFVSGQWKGKDSILYDYNSDGQITWFYSLQGDSAQNWNLFTRITYTYDAQQQLQTRIREKGVGGNWAMDNKYQYTYDASGNNTLVQYFTWNGSTWANTGLITYSGFNASGKYAQAITQAWNGSGWGNISRSDYTYVNGQYLVQSEDQYLWDMNAINWKKYQRHYYTYVQDSLGTHTIMKPDSINNWMNMSKETNFYNASILRTQHLNQLYDTTTNTPYNVNRTVFTYSPSNKVTESKYELPLGSQWNPDNRTTFVYNADDSLVEYFKEVNTGAWEYDTRTTISYNAGLPVERKNYIAVSGNWQEEERISMSYTSFDSMSYRLVEGYNGGSYTPIKQEFFYYNTWPLGVSQLEANRLLLYPNPVKDQLYLQFDLSQATNAQCIVYDIQGRKRIVQFSSLTSGHNNMTLPTDGLEPGYYIVHLQTAQGGMQQLFLKTNE